MNRLKSSLTIISAALLCSTTPLLAQQKRVSPHETISTKVGDALVTVVYGRPYAKDPKTGEDREIWGKLVPYDQVWRMGADEATLLVTGKPLVFGETVIPAGAYSLFLLPTLQGETKLIISKQLGEWGAYTYDEKQDLARITLKKGTPPGPVDQFLMRLDKDGDAGILTVAWKTEAFSTKFAVKK